MINKNDPAMPCIPGMYLDEDGKTKKYLIQMRGITIRAQFAAMAMQGFASNTEFVRLLQERVSPHEQADFMAMAAVEQADALIDQLNKPL